MEPVGNLRSLRCPLACRLRKKAATIPADDFNLRVLAQPFCAAFNASIREDIDDCVSFEIDNDGSVSLGFAPAPIIDADDSWRLGSILRALLKLPKHRVIANSDAQTEQETLGRPPTCRMSQMADNLPGMRGATCKWTGIVKLRDISKAGTCAHDQTQAIWCLFRPPFST